MKKEIVEYKDTQYEVRSIGFFKANALLIDTVLPIFPLISDLRDLFAKGIDNASTEDLTSALLNLMSSLDSQTINKILREGLSGVYVNHTKFDPNEIDDYELLAKLLPAIYRVNYSTLGKLLGKLDMKLLEK